MDEQLVLVNKAGEITGYIPRKAAIEGKSKLLGDNFILAVQLWIFDLEGKKILMQRRTGNKDRDPEMIDVCSGHVTAGENPEKAILREAREEEGIPKEKLLAKLQHLCNIEIDFTKFGRKGRYYTYEYITFIDSSENLVKQDDEVEELFWMSYEEVKKAIQNGDQNMRIPYNEDTKRLLDMIDKKIKELDRNNEER